jgi:hypothetical protein
MVAVKCGLLCLKLAQERNIIWEKVGGRTEEGSIWEKVGGISRRKGRRKKGGTMGSFGWSRRSCCHFRIVAAEASAFRRFAAAGDGWDDDVHEAVELSHPSIISMKPPR